jgi:hypothetical protein
MDLTSENVRAVFLDSLWDLPHEGTPLRVRGVTNEFLFDESRLESHATAVRGFLSHMSTLFYEDRGAGHSCLFLGSRRDGVRWEPRPQIERLLVLGLGLKLIDYCLERHQWYLFPGGLPYVRLRGDLFKLWATFRRLNPKSSEASKKASSADDKVTLSFGVEAYPPPAGCKESDWFRPSLFKVAKLDSEPTHVAEAFYNSVIVDGFFKDGLPSWILDPKTTLQVY